MGLNVPKTSNQIDETDYRTDVNGYATCIMNATESDIDLDQCLLSSIISQLKLQIDHKPYLESD